MSPIDPIDDARLEELLDRWDDARAQGRTPSAAELTQDPELLPALETAIAKIEQAEAILGGAPLGPAAKAGGVPGRFESLVDHEKGGMGVVYRAWDAELRREVAYKVIRPGLSADGRAIEKFLKEARITARLQHPGVVAVHALTTDVDQRPAYAMRFVEGIPLLEAVASFHSSPPRTPNPRVAWQGILNHFLRVCQTIGHAHSLGILHRDISPRNILLVGEDETLVIDWGLAIEIDKLGRGDGNAEEVGEALTRAGTAAYTAPEVWESAPLLTSRSDIYSLGAILYLMLSGKPPYPGRTHEVIPRLLEGPPPDVASIRPDVPRPLASICAKAMSRSPVQRYATAEGLAADVNKWLAGERVGADREPWRETAWRWAGRHRTSMGIAATILLAVAIGGPLAFVRERRLRGQAQDASIRADRARDVAQSERQRALATLDEIITQAETIGGLQASLPAAKAVLDRAVHHLEERAREAEANRADRGLLANDYARAGRIRFKLNQWTEAENAFAKAAPVLEELSRENPEDLSIRNRLAMCWREWAVVLARQGHSGQARPLCLRAAEILEPIAESAPAYRNTLAKVHMILGNISMFAGQVKGAREAFERGRVLASRVAADFPNDPGYRGTLADILSNEGMLSMIQAVADDETVKDRMKLSEAQEFHRKALELRQQLVQSEPGNTDYIANLASSFNHVGNTLQLQGGAALAHAESSYREALGLLEPLAVSFPGVAAHRQDIAQILNNLNELYAKQKRWDEAEALARRGVDDFTRLEKNFPGIPEHPAERGLALERLANTLRLRGKKVEADEQELTAAVAFARGCILWDDPSQREQWASKAVASLQRLGADGFFSDPRNAERLRAEQAFQCLRSRSDFGELLRKLNQTGTSPR